MKASVLVAWDSLSLGSRVLHHCWLPVLLLTSIAGGALVTADGTTNDAEPEITPAELLRGAWIQHRLETELAVAQRGYQQVLEHPEASVDLQARALLGLTLIARDQGEPETALKRLESLYLLQEVSVRWRRTALLLRAQLEGKSVPEDPSPESDLLQELQGRVTSLQGDLERVRLTVTQREAELENKDRMLRRLEEREREAIASLEVGARRRAAREPDAVIFLDDLVKDDRRKAKLERYFTSRHMLRAREYFRDQRYLEAYNELKKVLQIDRFHREARELSSRCRTLIAAAAGSEGFPPPDPETWAGTSPQLVAEVTQRVMQNYLAEARSHWQAGRTLSAFQSASKVFEEYSYAAIPFSEEFVRDVVGGAERILQDCLGASATPAETEQARALREEQLDLIAGLREQFAQLLATSVALEEADESAQRLAAPSVVRAEVAQEFEACMQRAERAIAAQQPAEAARSYRDMLVLLEWVPELDAESLIAPQLRRQLERLEGGRSEDLEPLQLESPTPLSEDSPTGDSR